MEDGSDAVDFVAIGWKVVDLGGCPLKGERLNDGWLRGDQLGGFWGSEAFVGCLLIVGWLGG